MNLRETARFAPYCMACGLQNPNGDMLCLAHSNELRHGKGMGKKSEDSKGAILCKECHDYVDGRIGKLSREIKQAVHTDANLKTVEWWKKEGYLK